MLWTGRGNRGTEGSAQGYSKGAEQSRTCASSQGWQVRGKPLTTSLNTALPLCLSVLLTHWDVITLNSHIMICTWRADKHLSISDCQMDLTSQQKCKLEILSVHLTFSCYKLSVSEGKCNFGVTFGRQRYSLYSFPRHHELRPQTNPCTCSRFLFTWWFLTENLRT